MNDDNLTPKDHSHSFNSTTSNNTYIGDYPPLTTHNCCGFGCYCRSGLGTWTTTIQTVSACEYCMKPVTHTEKSCPRISLVRYHPDGAIAEIEFFGN